MKKAFVFLAILVICALVVCGCSGNASTPAATSQSKPAPTITASTAPAASPPAPASTVAAPQSGGTLKMYSSGNPHSIGYPITMTGVADGSVGGLSLESLFRYDENFNITPLLATGYKSDVAAKAITISLQKGVKFHDGADFNAAACKWNLDQFKSSNRPELKSISSVDIVDDYTVRLNLSVFQNTIITNLATDPGRMISPTAFKAHDGQNWAEKNPVGTGPFQFVGWTPDVSVNFKRFDGYWGGKPYLDGVSWMIYSDSNVALMDFKAGNLDCVNVQPRDAKALSSSGQYNIVISSTGMMSALAGDVKDPKSPFNDLKVRQAMAYAIDAKTLADSFGLGYYLVTNQYAVPGSAYYNPNVAGYPYNPQKAKDLLTQAGYPNGFDTVLNFFNNNQTQMEECTAMQNQLNAVGIRTTLNPLARPGFADIADLGKGFKGIVRTQNSAKTPDPLVLYSLLQSGANFAGILMPQEFKDAYDQALTAPDEASKQKAIWQMAAIANDKYCMATQFYIVPNPVAKTKKLHDDSFGLLPNYYLLPKAWLSK
jgi:peptide/nickel transport system substrate-binding protein